MGCVLLRREPNSAAPSILRVATDSDGLGRRNSGLDRGRLGRGRVASRDMLKGVIDNDRVSEGLGLLSETGTSPLRIQKGPSRSPSPQKEPPLPPMHPPIPYTLNTRRTSNSSSVRDSIRRTSSSYSAMRTNSLVKNSPFLNGSEPIGPTHRPAPSGFNVYRNGPAPPSARSSLHISMPSSSDETAERTPSMSGRPASKIPTPSRASSSSSQTTAVVPLSSDEGSSSHRAGYRRRQSKGLASLSESERVSKSPFISPVNERNTPSPGFREFRGTPSPEMGERESDWEELGNPSPELPASTHMESMPELPELSYEPSHEPSHEPPPEPILEPKPLPSIEPIEPEFEVEPEQEQEQEPEQEPERTPSPPPPPPPPKASLTTRLAAIAARAKSPPPSTPARSTVAEPPTPDVSMATPPTIHTFPLELPETPGSSSIYRTPLTPSQALPDAESTPIKADTSASSLIIHTDIPMNTTTSEANTPTSPSKSPRRSSANAPSPTRSSLVSKRLLGPRSSPSPRTSMISTGTDTSGISRTSSGRLISRRGSAVARKNSRVARKPSAGKYIGLARRSSRRSRKKVTFDERCDVLEYDIGVGIDGEVWSDDEDGEEWETEEVEGKEGPRQEGSRFTSVSPPPESKRYASPPADANRRPSLDGPHRFDSPPMDPRRYPSPPMVPMWNNPVAWMNMNPMMVGMPYGMPGMGPGVMPNMPPNGSTPPMGSSSSMPNMPSSSMSMPSSSMPMPMSSSSSMPLAVNKYAHLGVGAPDDRQARRDSNGRRDSNSRIGLPNHRDSLTGAAGRRDSLAGAAGRRDSLAGVTGRRDSNMSPSSLSRRDSSSKYGPNTSASRIPARSSLLRNSVTGLGNRPGVVARPRVPGRSAGEGSRDSFSRVDLGKTGSDSEKAGSGTDTNKTATGSVTRATRKAVNYAPEPGVSLLRSMSGSLSGRKPGSNLDSVDSFGAMGRTSDFGSFSAASGKLVVVNPESEDEAEEREDKARSGEEEKPEGETRPTEHTRSLSGVVVQNLGVGVVVQHTGGNGPGVLVHHSGNGMVDGVYSNRPSAEAVANVDLSVNGITVHHSGHSAVQVFDERSPEMSAGDISLATGMSFASLVSFDSIISRSGRIDESAFGEQSRIDEEDEQEDSEVVGGRILHGLDVSEEIVVKTEDVSIDLSNLPEEDEKSSTSPILKPDASFEFKPESESKPSPSPEPRARTSRSSSASPTKRAEGLPIPPTHSLRHLSPGVGPRHLEPQFTGGSANGRSPRISRDEVLRKLMDRRTGGSVTPTGRASPRTSGQASPRSGDISPTKEPRSRGPRMSGARLEIERLMAGVARGFADNSGEGSSLGFHPGDESHTSLPYRRNEPGNESRASLARRDEREEPETVQEEEEPEPEEEQEQEPEREPEPEPEPEPKPIRAPSPVRARRTQMQSTNSASGETETETEEAITPPPGRSYASNPSTQRPVVHEPPQRLSALDPGRASAIMSEASSRPTSYLSVSSSASSKPEMSGRDRIKAHEEMILAKRRELRGGPSRVNRRRSRSTSEARASPQFDEQPVLNVAVDSEELALEESFDMQLRKIYGEDEERTYHLREASRMIRADDKVAHHRSAGDVDSGKAWRTVRRPSDMNEYAKEIQEIRAQSGSTKAHGKVFVKGKSPIRCLQKLCIPIPQKPTYFTCTLNNGIHFVTTPECLLEPNAMIDQEFELIEHGKLAFSLTIKIRKDSHIVDQIRYMSSPSPQQFMPAPPPRPSGFRSLFSSTPKNKPKQALLRRPTPVVEDHLVRYMKSDGSIGRAYINFKDIVKRCDTRLYETSYPLIGEWSEDSVRGGGGGGVLGSVMSAHTSQRPIGELVLHIFRLPPLPGVPPETLPQSLEECHRGLSAVAWHKKIYYQGLLTQNGGDITSWRRRQFRIIGSNLIAYNDVTGKAIATISLKQALAIEDDQNPLPPGTVPGRRGREESDAYFSDNRCFRLLFDNAEDIAFYADSDEEKTEWLRILRALVGNIPPHPLWAELVWQRHEQAAAAQAQSQQQAQQAPQSQQAEAQQAERTQTPQPQSQPQSQSSPRAEPIQPPAHQGHPQPQQSPRVPTQHPATQYGPPHRDQSPIPQMWQPRGHSLSPAPTQHGRPPRPPSKTMPPPPAPLPIPRSQAWR